MISSQLGRVILGGSGGSEDEMSAAPDSDGRYGPIDGLLDEIADAIGPAPGFGGERRPGTVSSAE